MRVLFFTEYGSLNGGEYSFLTALPFLQNAGFEFVAAIEPESDLAKLFEKKGVAIEPFSVFEDGVRKPLEQIRKELSKLLVQLSPTMVHANSLAASRIVGPVVSQQSARGVGYIRDIVRLSGQAMKDLNQLDRVVSVCQAAADFHIERGLESQRVRVIHNGVDLQRFFPAPDSAVAPVCLCIGQIGMRKGVELSLQLFQGLCEQVGEAELWIVGQRHSQKQEAIEYEQRLRDFATANFAPSQIKWLGRRNDIPELMQQAQLLIHCAKQEPLGRVLLEAAATGLPIVTTDVGGTPEILEGLPELMFSPDDVATAAVPVATELLLDHNYRGEVSTKLRSIAESKFCSLRAGNDLLACYRDLIAP